MSQGQSSADIKQNTVNKVAELRAQLVALDENEGANARELLNLYSALHADPSGDAAKDEQGRTAAEVYAEYEKVSSEVAAKREPLEAQLNELSKGLGLVADYQTLRQAAKERAEASAAACQEPPAKDLTEFSNPELDKIRSQLQTNPLPGGEKASIDDGTGGASTTTTTTTSGSSNK